ncbi:TPA: hypothetical protein JRW62_002133 [Elizabethkingia meningoseptica]|uniref:GapS4a family protein n=1 Tax=Elizabethkingia meningoseptica TaxID=238 RepID=UPI0022F1A707|nr:hypothetical protein [Elizabethkingia meningoseptica]EJK5327965.1 hypothetical protein [Elizabethkingia meningoseptica]WBS74273.1 hypothetical protein PF438_15400 [Elizabethkingia meningoseptica]HAY3563131.1 hypothetical protein [Elizabethkingia meningoseptica]
MGEWSKSIGEKGESIVKFIFEDILNFNSLIENDTINCIKGGKHKSKDAKSNKTSHGIDGLVSYKNPLEDYTLDVCLISSKYVGGEYPQYPSTLFREHIKDLAHTLECFNNSKLKNSINQGFNGINKTEIFGVLVWLSNTSDLKFDLVSKVNNIQIDSDLVFDKIILLDNNKVNFLYESIYRTKETVGNGKVDFVYHNTGLNFMSIHEYSYGQIFPLNYLYSDIIALRIEKDNIISLTIFINDDFEEEQFVQILNFAKSFDHLNSIHKIALNYRTYDYLLHEKLVKEKLMKFSNYRLKENLEIKSFPSDFRN